MSTDEIIAFADGLFLTTHDSPFKDDFTSVVIRHSDTKKWFGLLFYCAAKKLRRISLDSVSPIVPDNEEVAILNLKCDEGLSPLLCNKYRSVIPSYHMNKKYWITVVLGGDLPDEELKKLILISYDLTAKPLKKTNQ